MSVKGFLNGKIIKNDVGEPTYLTWKETLSYAVGRGAQGMGTSMMNNVNYFMTNILGISPGAVASFFVFAGLWDAVNDVALGILIDKTRSKHGKMRVYILYAPIFCAIFVVMFFINKSALPYWAMFLLTIIAYEGWEISYTAFDVPMGALAFSITPSSIERTKLFGYGSIVRAVLSALPAGFVSIGLMFQSIQENPAPAYLIAGCMSAAGMIIFTRFTFKNTRERAAYSEEKPSVKECLQMLFQNKPLLMLFISNMMFLLVSVPSSVGMYFAVDMLGDAKFIFIMTISLAPMPFIVGLGVPKMVEKLGAKTDFKKIYRTCCLFATVMYALFFVTCYSGLVNKPSTQVASWPIIIMIMIFSALSSLPAEIKNLCGKVMESETVDYMEWRTGKRNEGIMLAVMSFTGKLTNSWSSSIALFILGIAKYATHADAIPVPQTETARFALFAMYTLVPLTGYLLMQIPMKFYNITGVDHRRMREEIEARKQASEEAVLS